VSKLVNSLNDFILKPDIFWKISLEYQTILSDDCSDIGLVVNCAIAVKNGLCDSNQAASDTVRIYCQKSCNLCPSGDLFCIHIHA
jgi:hypothetical protein